MSEEPDAKRQRTDFKLQAEDEFLEAHPGGSTVRVQAPALEDSDTLNGQVRRGRLGAGGKFCDCAAGWWGWGVRFKS